MEIKPLESKRHFFSAYYYIDESEIRQLEADYKEAIEALIESTIELINIDYTIAWNRCYKNAMTKALKKNQDNIAIIEKAYGGESWEDIRRKKNGD